MTQATRSREELVETLAAVFRQHGYEGATLARLAEATGLVKASLYYQFPRGKEDMAAAVLDLLGARIKANVLAPLAAPGSPRDRLVAMSEGLATFYDSGRAACVIDVFGIGGSRDVFRDSLSRAVSGLGGAIASVLREAGQTGDTAARRAEDAVIAIQGSLVVSRAMGSTAPFLRTLRELPDRLLAG